MADKIENIFEKTKISRLAAAYFLSLTAVLHLGAGPPPP